MHRAQLHKAQVILPAVTKRWRTLLIHHFPEFWRFLRIRRKTKQKQLDTWVERSRGYFTDLVIEEGFQHHHGIGERPEIFNTTLGCKPAFDCLRSLEIGYGKGTVRLHEGLPGDCIDVLKLETLIVASKYKRTGLGRASLQRCMSATSLDFWKLLRRLDASVLRVLDVEAQSGAIWQVLSERPFPNLEDLSLTSNRVKTRRVLAILSGTPNLRIFQLRDINVGKGTMERYDERYRGGQGGNGGNWWDGEMDTEESDSERLPILPPPPAVDTQPSLGLRPERLTRQDLGLLAHLLAQERRLIDRANQGAMPDTIPVPIPFNLATQLQHALASEPVPEHDPTGPAHTEPPAVNLPRLIFCKFTFTNSRCLPGLCSKIVAPNLEELVINCARNRCFNYIEKLDREGAAGIPQLLEGMKNVDFDYIGSSDRCYLMFERGVGDILLMDLVAKSSMPRDG